MAQAAQEIRFCTSGDGVRIAYATTGSGPPLVKVANWLTHLEFDWTSPVWRHWLAELSRDRALVRYDERGCGLSDWNAADLSFEGCVRDLEAVVAAAGARALRALRHVPGRRRGDCLRGAPPRPGHAPCAVRGVHTRARDEGAHARRNRGERDDDPARRGGLGARVTRRSGRPSRASFSRTAPPSSTARSRT